MRAQLWCNGNLILFLVQSIRNDAVKNPQCRLSQRKHFSGNFGYLPFHDSTCATERELHTFDYSLVCTVQHSMTGVTAKTLEKVLPRFGRPPPLLTPFSNTDLLTTNGYLATTTHSYSHRVMYIAAVKEYRSPA